MDSLGSVDDGRGRRWKEQLTVFWIVRRIKYDR